MQAGDSARFRVVTRLVTAPGAAAPGERACDELHGRVDTGSAEPGRHAAVRALSPSRRCASQGQLLLRPGTLAAALPVQRLHQGRIVIGPWDAILPCVAQPIRWYRRHGHSGLLGLAQQQRASRHEPGHSIAHIEVIHG